MGMSLTYTGIFMLCFVHNSFIHHFIELLKELINMPDILKLTRVLWLVTGGTILTLLSEQAKK